MELFAYRTPSTTAGAPFTGAPTDAVHAGVHTFGVPVHPGADVSNTATVLLLVPT